MKSGIVAVIAVVCLVGSAGGTYLFLKNDIDSKQVDYDNLKSTYESLQDEVEENEANRLKYEKLMFQGIRKNIDGDYSYGYAYCDFENAGLNYDEGYLEVAISYYDSADVTFASSNNFYKEAESYFSRAIEFAPNDNLKELARLMENESMYGALITSALHQNCEYMSQATAAYNNGNYDIGDEQLEIANSFIDEHDSLIPAFENATTDINSLLDIL